MTLSLREQFEQLARRPAEPRILSGSPVDFDLTVPRGIRMTRPIDAIKALRDGGISLIEAKSAYEALVQNCELRIHLPGVADRTKLKQFLAACGITAREVEQVSL